LVTLYFLSNSKTVNYAYLHATIPEPNPNPTITLESTCTVHRVHGVA